MFKGFSKAAANEPAKANGVVAAEAANAVTERTLKSLNDADAKLTERLELKGRLHSALLERLNLSVIDKVQTDELRREVANPRFRS